MTRRWPEFAKLKTPKEESVIWLSRRNFDGILGYELNFRSSMIGPKTLKIKVIFQKI